VGTAQVVGVVVILLLVFDFSVEDTRMNKAVCCSLLLASLSATVCSCGGGGVNGVGQTCVAQQGTTCESLTTSSGTRTYLLHVPSNFQKNSGALVIVLHGSGGDGLGMEIGTGFSAPADRAGFAVVYPDVLFESKGGQTNWALMTLPMT
jgi:poly(3-hydroxybutyrate) depolymerase